MAYEQLFPPVTLKDGRLMTIRLATDLDIEAIASAHDLPTKIPVHPQAYRAHFRLKAAIYVDAPYCGIVTGWVDDRLAGFQFYCGRLSSLRKFLRSPAGLWCLCRRTLQSGLLRHPLFILTALRQGRQHLRSPNEYPELSDVLREELPDCGYGTLQTVVGFRQLGVGYALHQAASEMLRCYGNTEVLFWIASDNEASLKLHDKSGCTRLGMARRLNEDCWLLRKDLTEADVDRAGLT